MLARRAADRVKIDYDADAPEAKLTGDQRAAAGALAEHGALDQLLMAADPASADRRVLGLLFALDRMEIARGLPKQLKFYAVGHIFTTTFDAEPPPATALNPNATPQPGTWLTYLTDVALLAGHRVPEGRAITNKVWETLAWTGIGRGFADQLRREAASLPDAAIPELTHVTASVAARLDSERSTAESLSAVHASNELTARQEP